LLRLGRTLQRPAHGQPVRPRLGLEAVEHRVSAAAEPDLALELSREDRPDIDGDAWIEQGTDRGGWFPGDWLLIRHGAEC